MPETQKRKNFTQLKIKRLRKKLPKRCFKGQGGSLSMKKLSITTRNTGRCTELHWLARMAQKPATSMYSTEPKLAFVVRIRGINSVSPRF